MNQVVNSREKKAVEKPDFVFKNYHQHFSNDREEILSGLQQKQKTLNPKYFYDTLGSELFEQITDLEEYYPTRTERKILSDNATEIASYCGENCVLVEPGSGSSEKVRLLLDHVQPKAYVPMDIAGDFLQSAAASLVAEFPWLDVHAVCADFKYCDQVLNDIPAGKRVVFYPGSTLGNMSPEMALAFLSGLKDWLAKDDYYRGGVLIGIDLHKSAATLNAAYDDRQGVTAQFNLNMLEHINRILGGNFALHNFSHKAFYNESLRRIEMHLVSRCDHVVWLGDTAITFTEGETIHTENSYKYSVENFTELAANAGLSTKKTWLDEKRLFSVHYLELA